MIKQNGEKRFTDLRYLIFGLLLLFSISIYSPFFLFCDSLEINFLGQFPYIRMAHYLLLFLASFVILKLWNINMF